MRKNKQVTISISQEDLDLITSELLSHILVNKNLESYPERRKNLADATRRLFKQIESQLPDHAEMSMYLPFN